MPLEIQMLALAGGVLMVQFAVMAIAVNLQLGPAYTGGPRDERREPMGAAGRLHRAFGNMIEALVFFTLAVVVVILGDASTRSTEIAAMIFVAARVLYVPAYVVAIGLLRSVVWGVGFFATAYMVVQALL